jgi:hypothetical protein
MIDQQQQTDHAEHAAQLAEQTAEQTAEQQHADLVAETVRFLRKLGTDAHDDAQQTLARFAEEVRLRLAPNAHRYELLARQQHVALLAPTVAAELETTGEYDLRAVAQGVIGGYRATHTGGRDTLALGLLHATERVLDAIEEVAQYAADAVQQRAIEQHERDLAHLDAIGEDERREDGTYGHAEAFGVEL